MKEKFKFQWSQGRNEINGDNMSSIRREASRHFRNKVVRLVKMCLNETCSEVRSKGSREM
jgi:hypothetical protein